ncbi:MAG: hypothetical protein AAGC84_17020, partial [Pseudomonas sp.]
MADEQTQNPDIETAADVAPGEDLALRVQTLEEQLATAQDQALRVAADMQNVRRRAEDVAVGDAVLRAGDVLTPSRIGLAASLGLDRLPVAARPTVAVFASGDELVEP